MSLFDLPLSQLEHYVPPSNEPEDFDAFWEQTIAASRVNSQEPTFSLTPTHYRLIDTFDVTFSGFNGEPIKAWLSVPTGTTQRLPLVVEYIGYGGGRGKAHQFVSYALGGYAHLVMDNRGMGWGGASSETADISSVGRPRSPGFLTDGIELRDHHFLRRITTDAVLAVDAGKRSPLVDADRVAVTGVSMGGGLALAVAGLRGDLAAAMIDVPFLCDFPRAIQISDSDPYLEIPRLLVRARHLSAVAGETLSYFDGVNHAGRASAPALFSVSLMDRVCPPSTVFGAYNSYAGGVREIEVYEFNGHEGGQEYQEIRRFEWLSRYL